MVWVPDPPMNVGMRIENLNPMGMRMGIEKING